MLDSEKTFTHHPDPLIRALRSGAVVEPEPMYVATASGVVDDGGKALVITEGMTRVDHSVVTRLGAAGAPYFDFGVRSSAIRPGARCGHSGLIRQAE